MNMSRVSLAPGLQWFDQYYTVADLGGGAYAIGEPRYGQCNFSYLIVGSERALLFDTGPGIHDIRPVVRSLTQRDVLVVPSHLHFDHVGNLGRFDNVALIDLPHLRNQVHEGKLWLGFYQFLGFVEGFERPTFRVTQWVASGSDIDLGDRRVTVMSVPGHTPDSVVLLDREANRMFAGDFIYPSAIYAYLPGASLRDYAQSAQKVSAALDDRSVIYGAHGCDQLPTVTVPTLRRSDVVDLERSLETASTTWRSERGFYPRIFRVNKSIVLLANYPWM